MIPEINLLPKIEKKFKWGKWIQILLFIPIVLVVLFFIWQSIILSNEIESLHKEIDNQSKLKNTLHEHLTEIDQPKEIGLPETVQFLESIIVPASPILIEIRQQLSNNMILEHYDFDGSIVNFSISSNSVTDSAGFVEKLTNSPYFIDVKVNHVADISNNKRRYTNSFTVTINTSQLQSGGDGR